MNNGFFQIDTPIIRGDEKIKSKKATTIKTNCGTCGLSHSCKSPQLGIQGNGNAGILIVLPPVEKAEDVSGEYYSSTIGKELKNLLDETFDVAEDCHTIAAAQCYSKKKLNGKMTQACAGKVQQAIKKLNPKVILTFGKEAIDAVVLHKMTGRLSGIQLKDWVGYTIPDQEFKCFICPTWDHKLLVHNRTGYTLDPVVKKQIQEQIKNAYKHLAIPFEIIDYSKMVTVVEKEKTALHLIHEYYGKKQFAFDYETTGLKPHRQGHEIYTASFSDGAHAYAFPFFNTQAFRESWKLLLRNKNGKICHNAKFENNWTLNRANQDHDGGYNINNMIADTMLDAHILQNTKKTNLKFLTYVHFGIAGYDSEIDAYLQATADEKKKHGANAFNQIKKAPVSLLLKYNAMDSLFTYKLWEIQQRQLDRHLHEGSDFFRDASMELSIVENNGIHLDEENASRQFTKLTNRMDHLQQMILQSAEMKKWDRSEEFRPSAPQDIAHLLFDCLEIKADKDDLTPTGKPKSDIEALNKYNLPIVKNVLSWRKTKKTRDTYLEGFMKESVDGFIHTSLNLGTVDTFRSSSNDPNLQNIPARDEKTMRILRELILARPNHKLCEYDYKAMEAVIIAIYNQDPNWIKYVSDVGNDMHRDMAAKTVIRKKEDVQKDERQITKNGFVFPTIYTSYWKNTAKNMWDQFSADTLKHLRSEGIKNLEDYRSHIKSVERWFWEDQFPVGYEWMNKAIKTYKKKGYVELYTGFRCYGPLTRAQIINTPVQGTASHCKLWTLQQVNRIITKKKMNSKILLEIHDSIIPDINPAEEMYMDHLLWNYGTQKIREHWEWLNVPLFIEKKISAINGNWANMENMGLLHG